VSRLFNIGIVLVSGFCLCGWAARGDGLSGSPSAEEIIRNVILRAAEAPAHLAQLEYSFIKSTEREEFDSKGRVTDRKSSSNEMVFSAGVVSKKGGENKPSSEKAGHAKAGKPKRGENVNLLTDEILGRYVFTLAGRTNLNGRPAFELAFEPRKKNSGKDLMDRLLNRMAGTMWIDVEEFELARMQVQLESEMLVGAGLIGSLKKASFILERTRMPDGLWLERSVQADYEARKFLESTRVSTRSESSEFRKRGGKS